MAFIRVETVRTQFNNSCLYVPSSTRIGRRAYVRICQKGSHKTSEKRVGVWGVLAGDGQNPGRKMGKDRGVLVRKESSPMNGVQCIRYLINNSDVNSFPERSHWSTRYSPNPPVETTEHFLVSIA